MQICPLGHDSAKAQTRQEKLSSGEEYKKSTAGMGEAAEEASRLPVVDWSSAGCFSNAKVNFANLETVIWATVRSFRNWELHLKNGSCRRLYLGSLIPFLPVQGIDDLLIAIEREIQETT